MKDWELEAEHTYNLANHLASRANEGEPHLFEEAIRTYRRVFDLRPDYNLTARTLLELGHAYFAHRSYSEAVLASRGAIEANSDWALAYLNLGNVYQKTERWEKAERAYKEALRNSPESYKVHLRLGDLYRKQRRDQEADRAYRRAIQLAPDPFKLWDGIVCAYLRTGRIRKAQQEAEALLQFALEKPEDPERLAQVYITLAIAHFVLGHWRTAINHYRALDRVLDAI